MIRYRVIAAIISVALLSLSSCSGDVWKSASKTENKTTRFVLVHGQRQLANGQVKPVVLRMDSMSGETWVLGGEDPLRWEPVQDNLMPIYKKDPKTNKWGLGVSLPDGRDINELSKEELVRVVQAMAQNQKILNPNDPLGIRDKEPAKRP
jgi:hypothetical protein